MSRLFRVFVCSKCGSDFILEAGNGCVKCLDCGHVGRPKKVRWNYWKKEWVGVGQPGQASRGN